MSWSFPSIIHFQDMLNKWCNKNTNSGHLRIGRSPPSQACLTSTGTSFPISTSFWPAPAFDQHQHFTSTSFLPVWDCIGGMIAWLVWSGTTSPTSQLQGCWKKCFVSIYKYISIVLGAILVLIEGQWANYWCRFNIPLQQLCEDSAPLLPSDIALPAPIR